MKCFGFNTPSFGFNIFGFKGSDSSPKIQADFTTGEYKANGLDSTFADTFTFNRNSKAWISQEVMLDKNPVFRELSLNFLPETNVALYGRMMVFKGDYVYLLLKGEYGVGGEYSYLVTVKAVSGEPLQLIDWKVVGDVPVDMRELVLYGDYLYVIPFISTNKKFTIYSIADPENPTLVGTSPMYDGRSSGVGVVVDNLMYVHSWGSISLTVYDMTNPLAPELVSEIYPESSLGSGSAIVYDGRGYIWGVMYKNSTEPHDTLIRYSLDTQGHITGYTTYAFDGLLAVRRVVEVDGKLLIGRFNGGDALYKVNIDNPNAPFLEDTYHGIEASTMAVFDGDVFGCQNAQNTVFSRYSYNSADNTYEKEVLYEGNVSLPGSNGLGIFGLTNNGEKTPVLSFFDYSAPSSIELVNTIVEYDVNEPRLDNGLLIEPQATNYASYSFLPETGVNYLKGGVVFSDGYWTLIPDDPDVYLYPKPYPPAIPVGAVASLGTTTPANFSFITVNGYLNGVTQEGLVNYATVDSVNNLSLFGVVLDKVNTLGAVQLQYLQLEEGSVPTSPIKTQGEPATRAADQLLSNITGSTVTGDWDSTLSLSIVDGQLVHSGYGRIRTIEIN